MSSRQLRKLQKQRELEKAQQFTAQGPSESDDDNEPVVAKPRVSLFAALGGDDDNDDDEGQDEDDESEQQPQAPKETLDDGPTSTTKSKKKKKKKKKAKAVAAAETDEDEIDRAIKELNLNTQHVAGDTSTTAAADVASRRLNALLAVNPYHLKAVNEMRNLFGRDIIESADAEDEQERHAPPPGAKRLPEVSLRRNVFIQGREHWPLQTAGGLTMREVCKADDGTSVEYAYVHGRDYDAVQAFFFSCVQIGDPMRMVHLLKEVPYHVSTLLQVSSVAKQDQNMALAAELCERALFTFGRVTTSAFRQNIEQGRARLDFRRPENRQFWLAGHHYLKSLIRKGTYRTALEWAKLLYALDPKDPYAMKHLIHFLAIRAHESQWLIEFMAEVEEASVKSDTAYLQQSLILAKLQLGDVAAARADLVKGMKRLPWLYCTLFQELNLDTPPSIWGINPDTDSRSFWVKLYVYQTKDLWNNAQAVDLLKDVAKSIDKVDATVLPSDDSRPDLGATRLAYLDGQTSLLAGAPRELLDSQPNYEFDPLPPPEGENIFSSEGCRLPWPEQGAMVPPHSSEIEARMHNLFARNMGAAPGGGIMPMDQGNELDLDGLALPDPDEFRRELEEEARQGNGTGVLARLMELLGRGPGQDDGNESPFSEGDLYLDYGDGSPTDDEDDENHANEVPIPGSWPEDDADNEDSHAAPRNQ
ncbi:hypothetical protein G7046_g7129 [Stylonectria norvegica]|nr:hypothetical protein G7046_g7129 [Stylonectria norvegica]